MPLSFKSLQKWKKGSSCTSRLLFRNENEKVSWENHQKSFDLFKTVFEMILSRKKETQSQWCQLWLVFLHKNSPSHDNSSVLKIFREIIKLCGFYSSVWEITIKCDHTEKFPWNQLIHSYLCSWFDGKIMHFSVKTVIDDRVFDDFSKLSYL